MNNFSDSSSQFRKAILKRTSSLMFCKSLSQFFNVYGIELLVLREMGLSINDLITIMKEAGCDFKVNERTFSTYASRLKKKDNVEIQVKNQIEKIQRERLKTFSLIDLISSALPDSERTAHKRDDNFVGCELDNSLFDRSEERLIENANPPLPPPRNLDFGESKKTSNKWSLDKLENQLPIDRAELIKLVKFPGTFGTLRIDEPRKYNESQTFSKEGYVNDKPPSDWIDEAILISAFNESNTQFLTLPNGHKIYVAIDQQNARLRELLTLRKERI